jgi:putative methanogen marker protein 4
MNSAFLRGLSEIAERRRPKIGIGLASPDSLLIDGLSDASRFAEIVIVSDDRIDAMPQFAKLIQTDDPAAELIDLLHRGKIDGAVRGNVSAFRAMKTLSSCISQPVKRAALMEIGEWCFLLGPVGIAEGDTIEDRVALGCGGSSLLGKLGIKSKVSVLSGGRLEDRGRSKRVDESLDDGIAVTNRLRALGLEAVHRGILIEDCRGDDVIVAPDGISGNLVFRSLMILAGIRSYGAPALIHEMVYVDSSRTRTGFSGPIMLAAALASSRMR